LIATAIHLDDRRTFPTAIIVGTGVGARNGILFKNGESLELLHNVSTIVLDKTGTITEGNLRVDEVLAYDMDEEELLSIIASSEKNSEHPIGKALVKFTKKLGIKFKDPVSFKNYSGSGIRADVSGQDIIIGNKEFIERFMELPDAAYIDYRYLLQKGKTILFAAVKNEVRGIITLSDSIKKSSIDAIKQLLAEKKEVLMLSGDNVKTTERVAELCGINKFYADLHPKEKADKILELKQAKNVVAMVGDGVNSAPAFKVETRWTSGFNSLNLYSFDSQ